MAGCLVPECADDISILLIDHDTASIASLTSMLQQFSKRVMSVDVASKALSMIEKQKKEIGLIIANIEMPHIDSHSFLNALLLKDIPLILINPEIKTKQPSDLLTKRACFSLDKPISNDDIKNMWQHVLSKKSQELKKINITEDQENVMDKDTYQIEAFRANLKRQRISQASLLGRRPFIDTFSTYETFQKRKSIANVEWNTKSSYAIEIENKRKEWKKSVGRRKSLWNSERHMKFIAAISILGEEDFRPKSILEIMNDPNLTHRQVGSHLQKYKAQIDQISYTLPRNESRSIDKTFEYPSNYKYPFKISDLTNNLIVSNSLWNSLEKKNSASASITQFLFKNPIGEKEETMPKFHIGGKLDLSNHSVHGNVLNKLSMNVNFVPSTISNNPAYNILSIDSSSIDSSSHTGLVSTGLSSENSPILYGLPSNDGASNTCTSQMESERISIPQYDPNQCHPHRSILETDVNQIDLDFTSILDSFDPLVDECLMKENNSFLPNPTMNLLDTDIDKMDWVSFIENHSHHDINMNHMDWDPSTTNYVLPETNMIINFPEKHTNEIGWVSSQVGYVPFENMIPSEVDINHIGMGYSGGSIPPQEETNTYNVGFVSCETHSEIPPKTNILETNYSNPLDCVFPEDITSLETNTIQKSLVSCETSYDALDNMVPLETNLEEMNDALYDISIEDLISFDIDDNEKDIFSWLEDNGFSEENNMMESCDNIESVNQDDMKIDDNFDDYRECMDWINEEMNKDV
ncbi:putative two-component response regulator-like APRR6 [Arabidopsis thaliana]|uniref:PRR6 n=2 Tax=Arabidopsis TaxID=3701 RepID=A0A178WAI4_ARATH|nr:Homeobox-like domain superfamily [Arabidopsis thaliana x Arabidopsis arenosa]OAP14791.1 PRR6 [Arabidopsis thaliana]